MKLISSAFRNAAQAVSLKVEQANLGEHLQRRLDDIRNTPTPKSSAGVYSMVGLTVIIAWIAWHFGGFGVVLADLPRFLTGHALELSKGQHLFAGSLATIVLCLVSAMASAVVVSLVVGNDTGEHAVAKELANMAKGNQFGNLLFVVLLEELFARGLFLGLLTKIPFLDGPLGFYLLFFLGNGIWAAIHLANFTNPQDRSLWRVLPQFVGGVLLTYVFVKYGFIMGFVVHLGFDALLFSLYKREAITKADFWRSVYIGLVALVAYSLMDKPLSDAALWLKDGESVFVIPDWGHWDYVKALLCIDMSFAFVFGLLLFDRPLPVENEEKYRGLGWTLAGAVIAVCMIYGFYWVSGVLTKNVDVRALVVGLTIASMQRGRSGSSVARSFWCTVPQVFFSLCVMEAVGFWWAVAIILIEHVIEFPLRLLDHASVRKIVPGRATPVGTAAGVATFAKGAR